MKDFISMTNDKIYIIMVIWMIRIMITINAGDNSTRLLSGGGRREIRNQPKNKKKKCRNVQGGSIYDLFLMIMMII